MQVICDAQYKIRDIVCRWPGASHDSNIFQNSSIRLKFENGEMGEDVLLGDSGYPLRNYLITPISNPRNNTEQYFNDCQIQTRTIVERTFGIWKRKFPILSAGMRNKLETCQNIIIATAIIHNIARDNNEEVQFYDDDNEEHQEAVDENIQNNARQQFLDYFASLL